MPIGLRLGVRTINGLFLPIHRDKKIVAIFFLISLYPFLSSVCFCHSLYLSAFM
jgi:hypothetical protein